MKKYTIKEFDELAHAYFEPGDKTYWDAIEFAKDFLQAAEEEREKLREIVEGMRKESGYEWAPERVVGKTAYNRAISDVLTLLHKEIKS